MPAPNPETNFALLIDLARENSSERRRELLRQVTNSFTAEDERSEAECMMFEDIVATIAPVISVQARAAISEKIADSSLSLRRTARSFAKDDIEVAAPVLQRSKALTEDDLVEIVSTQSQDHMLSITKRQEITEKLSGALVDYGQDHVVGSLLENEAAQINRPSYDKIAERAETSAILQKPLIERQNTPLDLIGDMAVGVSDKTLHDKIISRLENASDEQLEAARAAAGPETPPNRELIDAKCWIEAAKKRKQFGPASLIEALRAGKITNFVVALAHLCDVRIDIVRRTVSSSNMDNLALLMKSIEIPVPIFNTTAMLLAGKEQGAHLNAKKYAEIYRNVPAEAAQRAIRFWKVREKMLAS